MSEFVCLKKQEYGIGFIQENIETLVYSALCFLLPFLVGHPQLVVGIGVNVALVLAALNVRTYKLIPIIIFPSLGVLAQGLIFGPFTFFLVFMIPFVWIGNFILVYLIKRIHLGANKNKWLSLGIAAVLKMAFLFAAAYVLVQFSVIPVIFLTAMGLMQLYTALAGGAIAFGLHFAKKKLV